MSSPGVNREEQEDPEKEEEQGQGRNLPKGWDRIVLPPPGRSYLLSPPLGKGGKIVKVFSYSQVLCSDNPTTSYPEGRFQEIQPSHLTWKQGSKNRSISQEDTGSSRSLTPVRKNLDKILVICSCSCSFSCSFSCSYS